MCKEIQHQERKVVSSAEMAAGYVKRLGSGFRRSTGVLQVVRRLEEA